MSTADYQALVGLLLGSFVVGLCAGYILAAFKMAAKSSSR